MNLNRSTTQAFKRRTLLKAQGIKNPDDKSDFAGLVKI